MNNTIQHIVESTRRYNLHSHTQYCDGRASMPDFVAAAVASGFEHYGFTPHSPIPIDSPCNMTLDNVDTYANEFESLKEQYSDRINLYKGMEVDYLGDQWGPAIDYFQSLGLDYMIGSVHFIPNQKGEYVDIDGSYMQFASKMRDKFDNDIRYAVDTFYAQSLQMLEAGGFEIIGHFDKIGHNASLFEPGIESRDWYVKHINRLIDAIIAFRPIVEINTKAESRCHRMFPHTRYWKTLKDNGLCIIVNSDAHYPERIDLCRERAFNILDSL